MGRKNSWYGSQLQSILGDHLRKCLFRVLSVGAIPNHIAFIMDGNRRFAKKQNMVDGDGHRAGYASLISMLNYCYELGIKYITVYAFSIENFKRKPEEVQLLMDLMIEKVEELLKEGSVVNQYGMRLYFIGNLRLLSDKVRDAAEKAMKATAHNSQTVLLICIAYTSYDEIVHAVQESCEEKMNKIQTPQTIEVCHNLAGQNGVCKTMNGVFVPEIHESCKDAANGTEVLQNSETHYNGSGKVRMIQKKNGLISHVVDGLCGDKWSEMKELIDDRLCNGVIESGEDGEGIGENKPLINLVDIEKHMYMSVAPDPDIVVRSSGETRLSNFLLWQTAYSPLYAPDALWPEMGLWQLVWAVLDYQQNYLYLRKKKKQL